MQHSLYWGRVNVFAIYSAYLFNVNKLYVG